MMQNCPLTSLTCTKFKDNENVLRFGPCQPAWIAQAELGGGRYLPPPPKCVKPLFTEHGSYLYAGDKFGEYPCLLLDMDSQVK